MSGYLDNSGLEDVLSGGSRMIGIDTRGRHDVGQLVAAVLAGAGAADPGPGRPAAPAVPVALAGGGAKDLVESGVR